MLLSDLETCATLLAGLGLMDAVVRCQRINRNTETPELFVAAIIFSKTIWPPVGSHFKSTRTQVPQIFPRDQEPADFLR